MSNWVTGDESVRRFPAQAPKQPPIRQVRIRALDTKKKRGEGRLARFGIGGFRHKGRPVEPGEVIDVDFDIADMLVRNGKAELVTG